MNTFLPVHRLNVYTEGEFRAAHAADYLGYSEDGLRAYFSVDLPGGEIYLASEGHGIVPVAIRVNRSLYVVSIDTRVYFVDAHGTCLSTIELDYLIFELHRRGNLLVVYTEVGIVALALNNRRVLWEDHASEIIADFLMRITTARYTTIDGECVTLDLQTGSRLSRTFIPASSVEGYES